MRTHGYFFRRRDARGDYRAGGACRPQRTRRNRRRGGRCSGPSRRADRRRGGSCARALGKPRVSSGVRELHELPDDAVGHVLASMRCPRSAIALAGACRQLRDQVGSWMEQQQTLCIDVSELVGMPSGFTDAARLRAGLWAALHAAPQLKSLEMRFDGDEPLRERILPRRGSILRVAATSRPLRRRRPRNAIGRSTLQVLLVGVREAAPIEDCRYQAYCHSSRQVHAAARYVHRNAGGDGRCRGGPGAAAVSPAHALPNLHFQDRAPSRWPERQ